MEANSKTQLRVGIFLTLGIVAILISIFMIGGSNSLFAKQARYTAHFDQVQGLAKGSMVSLAGLSVGNVESLDFIDDQNRLQVVLRIEERAARRVTEGSQVEIRTQGALGDKFVYIIPGDPTAPPLPEGSLLPQAEASDLLGVIASRGKETEKVFDIIHELHVMTKALNHENRMNKLIGNLTAASSNLRETSEEFRVFSKGMDFQASSKEIRETLQRLDRIVERIDRGEGTLGALINDPTLHDQLRGFLGASPRRQQIRSMIRTSIEKAETP